MGACASDESKNGTPDERNVSGYITKSLRKDKVDDFKVKKILFLGAGGTGKSTVFKQLRQIHGEGFSDKDKTEFATHIYAQIVTQMQAALNVYIAWNHRKEQKERKENDNDEDDIYDELLEMDNFELEASAIDDMECADAVMRYSFNKYSYARNGLDEIKQICAQIKSLWSEPAIKEIYDKRNLTKLETSSAYFWDKLDQITNTNYLPSYQDVMFCRFITKGIHEMQFEVKNDMFNIIDVGGQRSQRRKWMHCFEFVVAVIYIASLTSYDEVLHEDSNVNSMVDQLELFDDICNNPSLLKTSMILFLNKKDLFRHKHCEREIPLHACPSFADYDEQGVFDYNKGTQYIMDAFTMLNNSQTREIFPHMTCATDKNNIEKVFADVQLIVISAALSDGGYMDLDD